MIRNLAFIPVCARCGAAICDHPDSVWKGEPTSLPAERTPAGTPGAGLHGLASFVGGK